MLINCLIIACLSPLLQVSFSMGWRVVQCSQWVLNTRSDSDNRSEDFTRGVITWSLSLFIIHVCKYFKSIKQTGRFDREAEGCNPLIMADEGQLWKSYWIKRNGDLMYFLSSSMEGWYEQSILMSEQSFHQHYTNLFLGPISLALMTYHQCKA